VIKVVRPDEWLPVAGYSLRLRDVREVHGPNYVAQQARVDVVRGGTPSGEVKPIVVLEPEKRRYPVEGNSTTEAAIHTTFLADLYVVLGDPDANGGWVVRAYYNPLVPWIWGGAIVMFFGGLVSLSDRRHRVGAPKRSASSVPAAAA